MERVIRDLLANPPRRWRSPITFQVNTGHAERIIAELGKTKMVRLTVTDVERFLRKLAEDGYSTSVIGATKRIGARAVRRAMRDGLAGRNVFELAEIVDGTRRKSRSMTLAQIAACSPATSRRSGALTSRWGSAAGCGPASGPGWPGRTSTWPMASSVSGTRSRRSRARTGTWCWCWKS